MRVRATVRGPVQGIGFRPDVFRAAADTGVGGWVRNAPGGAWIEAQGTPAAVDAFLDRVARLLPPGSRSDVAPVPPDHADAFAILPSVPGPHPGLTLPPDRAPCPDCVRDLFDPGGRRFRHPFVSCARCGPRWSVALALPWDRESTTLRAFPLCPDCRREHDDPSDRRFHAQTIACPACGPRLTLRDPDGRRRASGDAALRQAEDALRRGEIVAVQSVGGYHLMVDARDGDAVERLRARKRRPTRPFALLFRDLAALEAACATDAPDRDALSSPAAPIVLLPRRADAAVADAVAPGLPWLGALLPPSPLHHLLAADLGFPLVATSGNVSGEPVCTDPDEARIRLAGIADRFLEHDRPIAAPADDSVARTIDGAPTLLRAGRGTAPVPLRLPGPIPPTLAWGGHLKAAAAVGAGEDAWLGPHVGDLEGIAARDALAAGAARLAALCGIVPADAVCDRHPDYGSTRLAEASGLPLRRIPHHAAHAHACLAEHGATGPALAVVWDGAGLGDDDAVWGGEFLEIGGDGAARRVASLRPFPLPGGDLAAREPRRAAVGWLAALWDPQTALARTDLAPVDAFAPHERATLRRMLERGVNAPATHAVGRLFDAAAALAGVRQTLSHEGEAAMAWEAAAVDAAPYPLPLRPGAPDLLDWEPMARGMLEDVARGRPTGEIAGAFHAALVAAIVAVARRRGVRVVCLSGGCFQNARLAGGAASALRAAGFEALLHRRIPPGDGGLAAGQLAAMSHGQGEND